MFGIGLFELLVIMLAALVLLGPQKLPELARQLGKFYVQIRRVTSDVRATVEDAVRQAEHDLLLEEKNKLQKLLSDAQNAAVEQANQATTPKPADPELAHSVSLGDSTESDPTDKPVKF